MKANIFNKYLVARLFPLLNGLVLSDEEWEALTRQGSIRGELRNKKTVYRLRYRINGRQRSRYISPRLVSEFEAELAALQKRRRTRRELARAAALARAALRYRKSILTPYLQELGYYFHGHAIRRCKDAQKMSG